MNRHRVVDRFGSLQDKKENYLLMTVCSLLVWAPLSKSVLLLIRNFIIIPYKIDTILLYMVYLVILFPATILVLKKFRKEYITILIILLSLFLITVFSDGNNIDYYKNVGFMIFFNAYPPYILSRSSNNYYKLQEYLNRSVFVITISIIVLVFILKSELGDGTYSQGLTYMLLPSSVISLNVLFSRRSPLHILNFAISTLMMLSLGARGPIVCLVLFLGTKFLLSFRYSMKKIIPIIFGICIGVFLVSSYYRPFLMYLETIMIKFNLSTRSLSRILENTFFQDNERSRLTNEAILTIQQHPLFGVGITRDRLILSNLMGQSIEEATGWYPHNIVLEFLLQYGVILGSLLLIFLSFVIGIALLKNKNANLRDIVCIFMAIGLYPLFFSGSYITSPLFFALIGFCINIFIKRESRK